MQKRLSLIAVACLSAAAAWAQPLGTSLGLPLATVKLVKTEVVAEKRFRDDVAKLEKLTGRTLTPEQRKAYLEDVINDMLFYQMCERDGVKVSDGEVDATLARLRAQRPAGETDEQFAAFLATQGVPMDQLRSYYKKQMLVQRWLMTTKAAEIAAMPKVTPADVLERYNLKKAELVRPDTVVLSILVYQFKDGSPEERAKGAAVMKKVSERIAKGESFDAVRFDAKAGGFDATSAPEYFPRTEASQTRFGKEFFDMAFSLKDGEASIPFETPQGWWILKRHEFLPQRQLELGDTLRPGQPGTVQDYLGQALAQEREAEFMKKTFLDLFATLRKQAEVSYKGTP